MFTKNINKIQNKSKNVNKIQNKSKNINKIQNKSKNINKIQNKSKNVNKIQNKSKNVFMQGRSESSDGISLAAVFDCDCFPFQKKKNITKSCMKTLP